MIYSETVCVEKGTLSSCFGAADSPSRPQVINIRPPAMLCCVCLLWFTPVGAPGLERLVCFWGGKDGPTCTIIGFCGSGFCSEPALGLSDFHQVSLTGSTGVSGCKSHRQFLGCLALLLYENRHRYLGNRGNGFFKKNILSFSLIHCSWRFGALLLNCSFYGYRHLHQQPFRRLSPRISIANPPPHPPF